MTNESGAREVIPEGRQPPFTQVHLYPIARFLIEERGHYAMGSPEKFGFIQRNGFKCQLTRRITDEDWAAINRRFLLPDTIGYGDGLIRDNLNRIDILGVEQIMCEDGVIPIEDWEIRQGLRQASAD